MCFGHLAFGNQSHDTVGSNSVVGRLQLSRKWAAFTLIEMIVVIAILMILFAMVASVSTGKHSLARRVSRDVLMAKIEQAREVAMNSHCNVVLAIAGPEVFPKEEAVFHLTLFKVKDWPKDISQRIQGEWMQRWYPFEKEAVLIDEPLDGLINPLDSPQITISNGGKEVKVYALVFHPHGGLVYPEGDLPVVLRVAEGSCHHGSINPVRRGEEKAYVENQVKIGRVVARPYVIN